ncbi:hypothetical protein EVJ58_g1763 [Rhodofomes roseus]|uniref:Cytochrome P450 n=1 Tax=Rhodofomes roseus TaxID=34475 RepID=A0A4Y9YXW0_9APHY|nr:hypothetical protein EVJ58_g1763 [Rhodofomes roseus]
MLAHSASPHSHGPHEHVVCLPTAGAMVGTELTITNKIGGEASTYSRTVEVSVAPEKAVALTGLSYPNPIALPQDHPWLVYSAWADTYGDVVHLEALSDHIVILNSVQAAKDLLDGRSAIYSDRPASTMADLCGFGVELGMLSYNAEWRKQRKIVAHAFSPGMLTGYHPVQEHEAPIIMRVTYGYTVTGEDDPMITMQFATMDNFSLASEPGVWMVDFIPQLRYLPQWMPGSSFLRTAERFRQIEHEACWAPYLWCKQRVQEGSAEKSLVASALSQFEGKMDYEEETALVWAATSGLGGGLDTNMSTIFTFLLAMLRHPRIQAKAQAEIDSVVGSDRLPSIADRPSLPYVRSIIAEVYRWHPAAPQGLPHALRQDNIYKDYLLPKSSIVIPNIWRMLRDPELFPQPDEFRPERFENRDSEMRKVTDVLFGFGRRACPGSQFAEGSIFAIVATILATCSIIPKVDEQGQPIIPDIEYTSGIIV